MQSFIQIGVIGLGKFGYKFGEVLSRNGVQVLGIDKDPENVKHAQHTFHQVLQADASNKETLQQIGIRDLSHVLISVGDSIAASAMIALYLKEFGVPVVWAKAVNEDHATLLRKVGVDEVIIPEYLAATQLANKVTIPGFIESLPFSKDLVIREVTIHHWNGKSLRDLNLSNRYGVQAIAHKKQGDSRYSLIPKADEQLANGDVMVVLGPLSQISRLAP
ncbi:MAG: TrkA family potassium uptake protein [Thermodesulfobacteriota bacterium]